MKVAYEQERVTPLESDLLFYNMRELIAQSPTTKWFVMILQYWKAELWHLMFSDEDQVRLAFTIVKGLLDVNVRFLCWDSMNRRWMQLPFVDAIIYTRAALRAGFGELRQQDLSVEDVLTTHHELANYVTYKENEVKQHASANATMPSQDMDFTLSTFEPDAERHFEDTVLSDEEERALLSQLFVNDDPTSLDLDAPTLGSLEV